MIGAAIVGAMAGTAWVSDAGAGTLIVSGASIYTGNTTISGGTLQLGNANAVGNSTVIISAANGLAVGPGINTVTLGGLGGAGNEALNSVTLQVGNNNGNATYSGVLSGNVAVTVLGNQVFAGVNTYTGGTTVSSGTSP